MTAVRWFKLRQRVLNRFDEALSVGMMEILTWAKFEKMKRLFDWF